MQSAKRDAEQFLLQTTVERRRAVVAVEFGRAMPSQCYRGHESLPENARRNDSGNHFCGILRDRMGADLHKLAQGVKPQKFICCSVESRCRCRWHAMHVAPAQELADGPNAERCRARCY